jgi:hypothetical protein
MNLKRRALIVAGVALGAVLAAGGYSLGASTASASNVTTDTVCATAKNVPVSILDHTTRCPRRDHAIKWTTPSLSPTVVVSASGQGSATATCPAGDYATGGSGYWDQTDVVGNVISSPETNGGSTPIGWSASGGGGATLYVTAYAICQ